jgi:hypothetical protein
MTRKFYKTIIVIEVLSEEPVPDGITLAEIYNEFMFGDWSGKWEIETREEMDAHEMRYALLDQGSSPDFFRLNDDEED